MFDPQRGCCYFSIGQIQEWPETFLSTLLALWFHLNQGKNGLILDGQIVPLNLFVFLQLTSAPLGLVSSMSPTPLLNSHWRWSLAVSSSSSCVATCHMESVRYFCDVNCSYLPLGSSAISNLIRVFRPAGATQLKNSRRFSAIVCWNCWWGIGQFIFTSSHIVYQVFSPQTLTVGPNMASVFSPEDMLLIFKSL